MATMKQTLTFSCHLNLMTLFLFLCKSSESTEPQDRPRIAIIGGGVGGSAVAYFLRELQPEGYSLDLFEKSPILGGRLQTVKIDGKEYETGGSIIHPRNQYAKELVKKLNLRVRRKEPGTTFALLKDNRVVIYTSHWTVVTILRILWRYGMGFNHLMTFVNKLIDDFSRIYTLQDDMHTYSSPGEILSAMNPALANLTSSSFKHTLVTMGFQQVLIEELVQAITFINYGQDVSVHAFVGMISVAGADDGLWSVENGNKQLAIKMMENSGAKVFLNSTIESIEKTQNSSYILKVTGDSSEPVLRRYDIVVIANSLELSQIDFLNFPKVPYDVRSKKYHRTVATIVAGTLQKNFTMSQLDVDSVFNCDRAGFFTSIGKIFPADPSDDDDDDDESESKSVYKIFSPLPLTSVQLSIIFSEIRHIYVSDWRAYPEYAQIPETLPSFVLAKNLYYLNAIEWAASAIEMSLISGKNIALLISQRLGRYRSYESRPTLDRTEL